MKKIFFLFLLITSLYAQNIHEYWALEVKRIIMCLVCKDEVDKYVNNMLKDYGLKGNLKVY